MGTYNMHKILSSTSFLSLLTDNSIYLLAVPFHPDIDWKRIEWAPLTSDVLGMETAVVCSHTRNTCRAYTCIKCIWFICMLIRYIWKSTKHLRCLNNCVVCVNESKLICACFYWQSDIQGGKPGLFEFFFFVCLYFYLFVFLFVCIFVCLQFCLLFVCLFAVRAAHPCWHFDTSDIQGAKHMLELSRHTPPSLAVPFKSDKTAALPSLWYPRVEQRRRGHR